MAAIKTLVMLLVLVAAVSAQGGQGGGQGGGAGGSGGHHEHHVEYHHHPKYKYEYAVHDPKHHDIHSHKEHRDGKKTEGLYTLHEADGTIRTVKYMVDGKSGFIAHVHREGKAQHPHHGESYQKFNMH